MKLSRVRILIIIPLLVFGSVVTGFAQTDRPYSVSPEPVVFEAASGDTQTETQFQVTNGGTALSNFAITADPLLSPNGLILIQASQFSVTPEVVPELESGAAQTFTVTINGLAPAGAYTGTLSVTYDTQPADADETIPYVLTITDETPPEESTTSQEEIPEGETEPTSEEEESAPPLDLLLSQVPGGPASDVSIQIKGSETAVTVPLYIRQPAEHEYPGVRFLAVLFNEDGEPLAANTTFTVAGVDIATEGVTVPADSQQVQVMMSVSGLTEEGTFAGDLLMTVGSDTKKVAGLQVSRFLDPSLKINGLDSGSALNLTLNTRTLSYPIEITSENRTGVTDLKIEVTGFTGTKANSVPIDWAVTDQTGPDYVVPGLGTLHLTLVADLAVNDTYTGRIRLTYAGKSQSTPLTVTRSDAAPTVVVHGLSENVQFILDRPCAKWLTVLCTNQWSVPNTQFNITLEETAGIDVIVNLPDDLIDFTTTGNTANAVANYDQLVFIGANGTPLTDHILIPAKSIVRLTVRMEGLNSAGSYAGTLRLTAPDATALDKSLKVNAKEPAWFASTTILLSILASYLVRFWLKIGRPTIVRRENAAGLLNRITEIRTTIKADAPGRAEILQVLEALQSQTANIQSSKKFRENAAADGNLETINLKLTLIPKWTEGYDKVYGLEPASIRGTLITSLQRIQAKLLDTKSASAEEAKTLLEGLAAEIHTVVVEALKQQVLAFKKNVEAKREDKKGVNNQAYIDLLARLAPAETRITAEGVSEADLVFVRETLQKESGEYVNLIANELIHALPEVPVGLSKEVWAEKSATFETDLRKAISQVKDGTVDAAMKTYEAVFKAYLETIVEALAQDVERRMKSMDAKVAEYEEAIESWNKALVENAENEVAKAQLESAEQNKTNHADFKQALAGQRQKITAIQSELKAGSIASANENYNHMLTEYLEMKEPGVRGVTMGAAAKASGDPIVEHTAGGGTHQLITTKDVEPRAELALLNMLKSNALGLQRIFGDILINSIILIVAVFWGLNLMYIDNPAWGTLADHIQVALWGFGLQQVGESAFGGLQSFVKTNFIDK